jgi:hypothetical protein
VKILRTVAGKKPASDVTYLIFSDSRKFPLNP